MASRTCQGGVTTPESNIFEKYLNRGTVFQDKSVLTSSYVPPILKHRDSQINDIANILSPLLNGEGASNVLLWGNTGTGKTVTAKYLGNQLKTILECEREGILINYIYVNCQTADTHYGVLYGISTHLYSKEEVDTGIAPPPTGWSLDRVHQALKKRLGDSKRVTVIILDEMDMFITKSGDDALYSIMKLNESDSPHGGKDIQSPPRVSIIGIANDISFVDLLDSRVKSRFSNEKVHFTPYITDNLQDILSQRAKLAFREGAIDDSVINLCASTEARVGGDARKAIEILRISGEIADRIGEKSINTDIVKKAYNAIERDYVTESIRALPAQSKHILMSVALNAEAGIERQTTGDVYETYQQLCRKTGLSPLSQRRVTDLISEMDTQGLVNARVRSFGRGGRTKEIALALPNITNVKNVLECDEFLSSMNGFKVKHQTTLV
ncbi:MAG: AAA family ATPase [Euryarchaeota archaeon]|nr:AAA family ATPase [Euryarchaeota archaeon]